MLVLIRRWRREYPSKSGGFSKKREISIEEQELKALKKGLRDVKMEHKGNLSCTLFYPRK